MDVSVAGRVLWMMAAVGRERVGVKRRGVEGEGEQATKTVNSK
jgi:hypothetical protein